MNPFIVNKLRKKQYVAFDSDLVFAKAINTLRLKFRVVCRGKEKKTDYEFCIKVKRSFEALKKSLICRKDLKRRCSYILTNLLYT